MSATANVLQAWNQEDFTSEVFVVVHINMLLHFTTSYLFSSPLVSCVQLNLSSHLTV